MNLMSLFPSLTVVLILLAGTLVACGGGNESSSRENRSEPGREQRATGASSDADIPGDAVGFISTDAGMAIVFDVSEMLSGRVPGDLERDFENWAEDLLDVDIDLDDIDSLVVVGDSLLIARGDFNFGRVRDSLEDLGYEGDEYRGFEVWGERASLIEDSGYVILGFAPEAIRDLLRSLDRGRNLLAYEQDSDLSNILDKVGSGFITQVRAGDCDSSDSPGCTAVGAAYSQPDPEEGTVRIRIVAAFGDEEGAEDSLEGLEESILDDSDVLDLLEVNTDGNLVVLEFDADEDMIGDFYDLTWDGPVQGGVRTMAAAEEAPTEAPTFLPGIAPTAAPAISSAAFGVGFEDARRMGPGEVASDRLNRDDIHYFEFDAQRGRTYIIETSAEFDSYLDLYDDSRNYLASDDDGGPGGSSLIQWTAEYSGTHVVAVSGYDTTESGSYNLFLTELDADDHAGSFDGATRIGLRDRLSGSITEGDDDYFVFEARRGTGYIFETLASFDTVIELYDEDGFEIGYDDDGGEDGASRLWWTADSSGDYYLKVRGYGGGDTGRYELSMIRVDPDDHGSSRRNATRMGSNDEADGAILESDADYFTFDARRGRTYTIETEADFDTVIELLDDRGNEIAYDDDGGRDSASRLEWEAPSSGEYFVVVRGYDSYSIGIYRLLISESR